MMNLVRNLEKLKVLIDDDDYVSTKYKCRCLLCGRKYDEYEWTYDDKLSEICHVCIQGERARFLFGKGTLFETWLSLYSVELSGQRANHFRLADELTRAAAVLRKLEKELSNAD